MFLFLLFSIRSLKDFLLICIPECVSNHSSFLRSFFLFNAFFIHIPISLSFGLAFFKFFPLNVIVIGGSGSPFRFMWIFVFLLMSCDSHSADIIDLAIRSILPPLPGKSFMWKSDVVTPLFEYIINSLMETPKNYICLY